MASRPGTMKLEEPAQLRALAHPLRLRLLGLLRTEGPATASVLGERLGVSPALASYHLRQLGSHGFIEEAAELGTDAKQRWWRAAHERTSWKTAEFLDSPERLAAEQTLGREVIRVMAEQGSRWVSDASTWSKEWIDAADMSDWILELTPGELRELRGELHRIVERRAKLGKRPGSELVAAVLHLYPRRRA